MDFYQVRITKINFTKQRHSRRWNRRW